MPRPRITTLVTTLTILCSPAYAITFETTVRYTYDRCTAPATATCTAGTPAAREQCKQCTHWEPVTYERTINVDLPSWYPYTPGKDAPRAQELMDQIARALYNTPLPRDENGDLVKLSELGKNPERYGWVRITSRRAHQGTIAIAGDTAGLTLGTLPHDTQFQFASYGGTAAPATEVFLHLSHSDGGKVGSSVGTFLFDQRPTFIAPATSAEELRAQEALSPLTWNAWVEDGDGGTYEPHKKLLRDHNYTLVVELSATNYRAWKDLEADPDFRNSLLARAQTPDPEPLLLRALFMPDTPYVQLQEDPYKPFPVDLKKLGAWYAGPRRIPAAPLQLLHDQGNAPFVFARVTIPFHTNKDQTGSGSIGVSVWHRDYPVGELVVPLCIEYTPCNGDLIGLRTGLQPLGTNAIGERAVAAGLQFIDFGANRPVAGVLHLHGKPRLLAWRINADAEQLTGQLHDILDKFAKASSEEARIRIGEQALNVLFPADANSSAATDARVAFTQFMRDARSSTTPPLLYVRMLRNSTKAPLLVPVGLLNYDHTFLGYHVTVEQPLSAQRYATADCVQDWRMPTPTLAEIQAITDELVGSAPWSDVASAAEPFCDWLTKDETTPTGAFLLMLGHYGAGAGFGSFDLGALTLSSNTIKRHFTSAAIALLNGCGTAGPGAEQLLTALNATNTQAIIATSHNVMPALARDYLECFATALREQGGRSSIGSLHACAIEQLRELQGPQGRYGSQALAYMLLGDPTLCVETPKTGNSTADAGSSLAPLPK